MGTKIPILALFLFFSVSHTFADEKQNVIEITEKLWAATAKKQMSREVVHPDGIWIATSQGGLWDYLSVDENLEMINEAVNYLDFKPHHINVQFLGSKKDVAYVTFYLVGNILDEDRKVIVNNYRTRASSVYVKLNGNWVQAGSHYSPLYGGSGVVFNN